MKNKQTLNWVVTGAKGSVGKALVDSLVERKDSVFGIDYGQNQKIEKVNDFYVYLEADLTNMDDVRRIFNDIQSKSGIISVWINIVGGFAMGVSIEDTTTADWSKMMSLNFHSALNCSRAVLPHMKKNGYGRIMNFGSIAAEQGMAMAGPYSVSKAAVLSLTKTTALEGKEHGITCNAIVPTIIDTPQNRTAMPSVDFTTWTTPVAIADKIITVVNSESNGEMIHV